MATDNKCYRVRITTERECVRENARMIITTERENVKE